MSSERIDEKGDGPYRGFGYLSLFSDSIVWQHGAKENYCYCYFATFNENYCNFATFNRIVDTKTIIVQMGPNIVKGILTDNNFSQNTLADLNGPKGIYNLHYGWCTRILCRAATRHKTICNNSIL